MFCRDRGTLARVRLRRPDDRFHGLGWLGAGSLHKLAAILGHSSTQ
jgi:hypothetical protein